MTDITKCPGDGCPQALRCWRYVAPHGHWQSMFTMSPIKADLTCDRYWPMDSRGVTHP